jgi:DinB superfamily
MVEGMIPAALFGEENPVAEWDPYFGENPEAVADASVYPSFAIVRKKYAELCERNLAILESLSEEDLDQPTKAPPKGREREFSTFGKSFLVVALHQSMHRAHVKDAQRAAARAEHAAQVA